MRTRDYQSQLEAVCNNASMAMFILDQRQHCTYMNPAAEELTGFTLAEVQGAPLHQFIHHSHPDGSPYPLEACPIDRAFPANCRERGEEVFVHKDGHFFAVAFTASPIRQGPRILGTVIEAQAIGERQQREAHERFLNEVAKDFDRLTGAAELMDTVGSKLCRYLRLTSCSFAQVDPSSNTITIQAAWQQHGRPSLLQTFRLSDYLTADCIEAFHQGETLVVCDSERDPRSDAEAHAQLQLRAFIGVPGFRDDSWCYLLAAFDASPRVWRADEVELVQEFARRVFPRVERARAEEALKESEARYRELFEAIGQGFCVFEILCDERGEPEDLMVIAVNPAFARHTGLHDATGKTIKTLVPEVEQKWLQRYCEVVRTGRPLRLVDYSAAMGRWFDVEAFATGRPEQQRVALLFSDITVQKQAEEALQRAHVQLLENDRRKDEFLAMLAHELRNPLAALRGAIAWLARHAQTVPARQLEILQRQSGALNTLVDDLLDVARVTRGLVVLRSARLDLRTVVERAVAGTQALFDEHAHALTVQLPAAPVEVNGDALRLEQVVSNLLTNAAKYTDRHGQISVTVEACDGEALLRVRDNGIGIEAELLPTIFDLFVQAERGLDRSQGGLGVGLTITRNLVSQHGGTIEVHSQGRGKGSEFIVRLPRLASERVAPEQAEAPAAEGAPLRVLVVDDNRDIAETFALLLEEAGHQVRLAFDGVQALAEAKAFVPQVALLDIGLPGMDGYEVAKHLREQPQLAGIVLIAITGYGGLAARERSKAAGFDEHLTKPVSFETLEALIASHRPPPASLHASAS